MQNTVLPTHSTKTETTGKSRQEYPRKITKSIVMDPVEADLKIFPDKEFKG